MTLSKSKLATATAMAAAISLIATPAAAVDLPRLADQPQAWDADALNVENRRHGGWDDDDWDDDIDGDDILAGAVILGGIALISAIAGSGNRNRETYPEPEPVTYPEPEVRYQEPAQGERYRSGGMGQAVEVCVAEVEAGSGPVGSVDRASRSGEGWYVAGELDAGTPFACWIDGSGRVTDVEAGEFSASYDAPADNGLRAEATSTMVHKQQVGPAPADDGRYEMALAEDVAE